MIRSTSIWPRSASTLRILSQSSKSKFHRPCGNRFCRTPRRCPAFLGFLTLVLNTSTIRSDLLGPPPSDLGRNWGKSAFHIASEVVQYGLPSLALHLGGILAFRIEYRTDV